MWVGLRGSEEFDFGIVAAVWAEVSGGQGQIEDCRMGTDEEFGERGFWCEGGELPSPFFQIVGFRAPRGDDQGKVEDEDAEGGNAGNDGIRGPFPDQVFGQDHRVNRRAIAVPSPCNKLQMMP